MEILSAPQLKRLQGSDVLVVDDSAAIRSVLVALLQRLGIAHIREAENGLSAMALMQQRAADIVLCDLNMPGMDGIQAPFGIRKLFEAKGFDRSEQPRVVGVTGHVLEEYTNQGMAAGMDRVTPKPMYISMLEEILVKYQ